MSIKKIKLIVLITLITVLTICAVACGQNQSETTVGATLAVAPNQPTEETITNDILSLPEMQFPHAAIMIVETPTAAQPYYIVKGGSNMNNHFATSFWFHVYTAPEYEIRLYDVVSDSEMTLAEWRNSKPKYDEVWEDEEMSEHHKNLVFAKLNGKTGVINSVSGEVVVPLIYDKLDFYPMWNENWLQVLKDGKYGVIDIKGNTVIALAYDDLTNSGWEPEWRFRKDGKWGLILPGNKILIPAQYDDIGVFRGDYDDNNNFSGEGLAPVKRNGKWGFVNRNNTLVVPFKYDKVQQGFGETTYGEVAFVWRDGLLFWIDKNGEERIHDSN